MAKIKTLDQAVDARRNLGLRNRAGLPWISNHRAEALESLDVYADELVSAQGKALAEKERADAILDAMLAFVESRVRLHDGGLLCVIESYDAAVSAIEKHRRFGDG